MAKKTNKSTNTNKKKASKIPVKNLSSQPIVGKAASEIDSSKELEKKAQSSKAVNEQAKTLPKLKKNKKAYRNIALFFILATLALVLIIFYFTFVKLTITIIPNTERVSENINLNIYDKDKSPESDSNALIGEVERIELQESKTYNSSGIEVIGQEVTGRITVINSYSKNQMLVATTRFLSPDNKLYRLKNTVNVPAGGQIEVEVYADDPSPQMAIEEPTKFTIPGLWAGLQDKIYGESKGKFIFKQQTKKYIQQSDIDKAINDIKKAIGEKARKKLGDSYKDFDQVVYKIDENSVSTNIDGKVGEEKEKFEVSMKTGVYVVAFSSSEISELAQNKLTALIPDNKKLIEFNKEGIEYKLDNYNIKQGTAEIVADFEGKVTLKQGAQVIDPNKIVGLTGEQLNDYLSNLKEISGYDINFSPSFINRVPKLVDRIKINISFE